MHERPIAAVLNGAQRRRAGRMLADMESSAHPGAAELRSLVDEYDRLAGGRARVVEVPSLEALAEGLVKARIARGVTQAALAGRLGVHAQQVQRWEDDLYGSASFRRVLEVARALGVSLAGRLHLPRVGAEPVVIPRRTRPRGDAPGPR